MSYFFLPSGDASRVTTPDHADFAPPAATSTFDIRGEITAWNSGTQRTVWGQWIGGGQASYLLVVGAVAWDRIRFYWSNDGSTVLSADSTVAIPGLVEGDRLQLRCLFLADDGASGYTADFYYKINSTDALTDDTGWTALGSQVTGTNTTIFNSTAEVAVGRYEGGASDQSQINVHQVALKKAGSTSMWADFRSGTWEPTGTDAQGHTWTPQVGADHLTSSITLQSLTDGSSNTPATSVDTASITPTGNALILAAVDSEFSTTVPTQPTASGCGLTWVVVRSFGWDDAGSTRRLTLFRAMGASPTSGAVTFDFSGETQNSFRWSICEFTGVDTGGTNGSAAVVQDAQNPVAVQSGTTIDVTLNAFADTDNATYGVASKEAPLDGDMVGDPNMVALHNVVDGGNDARLYSQYKLRDEPVVSWSWGTARRRVGFALEIAAAQPPIVLFQDLFTGTNGDPLDATKWVVDDNEAANGDPPDIQTNKARFGKTDAAVGPGSRATAVSNLFVSMVNWETNGQVPAGWTDDSQGAASALVADSDVMRLNTASGSERARIYTTATLGTTFDLVGRIQNTTGTNAFLFGMMAGTAWAGGAAENPNDGLFLEWNAGTIYMAKQVGGSFTDLGSTGFNPGASPYWYRLNYDGGTLRLKYWLDGNGEPAAWNFTAVTTDLTGSAFRAFASVTPNASSSNTDYYAMVVTEPAPPTLLFDTEVLARVTLAAGDPSATFYLRAGGIWKGSEDVPQHGYGIHVRADGTGVNLIYKVVDSAQVSIGSVSATGFNDQQLRFQVVGSSIRAKLWQFGTPEPEAWGAELTNTEIVTPGVPMVGTWSQAASVASYDIDTYTVFDLTNTVDATDPVGLVDSAVPVSGGGPVIVWANQVHVGEG